MNSGGTKSLKVSSPVWENKREEEGAAAGVKKTGAEKMEQEQVQVQEQKTEPIVENTETPAEPARWRVLACWAVCVFVYALAGMMFGFVCGTMVGNAFHNAFWGDVTFDSIFDGRDSVVVGWFVGALSGLALGIVTGTVLGGCMAAERGAFKRWFKIFFGVFGAFLLGAAAVEFLASLAVGDAAENVSAHPPGVLLFFGCGGFVLGILGATINCLLYCPVKINPQDKITAVKVGLPICVILGSLAVDTGLNVVGPCLTMPVFLILGTMVCLGFCMKGAKKGAIHGSLIGLVTGPIVGLAVGSLMVGKITFMSALFGAAAGVMFGAVCGMIIEAGIAAGTEAGIGRMCVIGVILGAVLGALGGEWLDLFVVFHPGDIAAYEVILGSIFCAALGAVFSAMIALKSGIGPVIGSRSTEMGVMFGLVFGAVLFVPWVAMVFEDFRHLVFPDFSSDVFASLLLNLLLLPLSFFASVFIGEWVGRKFGAGALFGAWFGGLASQIVGLSMWMTRDYDYVRRAYVDVTWMLVFVIGVPLGAVLGALLAKYFSRNGRKRPSIEALSGSDVDNG